MDHEHKRKMPHSDGHKDKDGKVDPQKFAADAPAVVDALATKDAAIHRIVIEQDDDHADTVNVSIERSHGGSEVGMHPPTMVMFAQLVAELVSSGKATMLKESEGMSGKKSRDLYHLSLRTAA